MTGGTDTSAEASVGFAFAMHVMLTVEAPLLLLLTDMLLLAATGTLGAERGGTCAVTVAGCVAWPTTELLTCAGEDATPTGWRREQHTVQQSAKLWFWNVHKAQSHSPPPPSLKVAPAVFPPATALGTHSAFSAAWVATSPAIAAKGKGTERGPGLDTGKSTEVSVLCVDFASAIAEFSSRERFSLSVRFCCALCRFALSYTLSPPHTDTAGLLLVVLFVGSAWRKLEELDE